MKQLYILILALAFSQLSNAQNEATSQIKNEVSSIPLSLAYLNYALDGHGLMISTERKINNGYVIEAALSAYKHGNKDQSISFNAIFSRRLSYDSGFSPQFGIGVGLVNTWIDDDIPQGTNIDEERAGDLSLSSTIKVSPFGWDFRTKKDIPIRIFFDCILQAQFPEFKTVDPFVIFQFGATYYFRFTHRNSDLL